MVDQERLYALIQTPRMQWYLQHGALARNVAHICQEAGGYLSGAMTYRQGWAGGGSGELGCLSYVVRMLVDDEDELTPALRKLLADAGVEKEVAHMTQIGMPAERCELPADIQTLLDLARRAVAGIEAILGGSRYLRSAEQVSELIRVLWDFSKPMEQFCATCEQDIVILLASQ